MAEVYSNTHSQLEYIHSQLEYIHSDPPMMNGQVDSQPMKLKNASNIY